MHHRFDFAVMGSQGDEYRVAFEVREGGATATCTCPAGGNRVWCKHRTSLLGGDVSRLMGGEQADLAALRDALRGTDLETAHARTLQAEAAVVAAKRDLEAAKRALARVAAP